MDGWKVLVDGNGVNVGKEEKNVEEIEKLIQIQTWP